MSLAHSPSSMLGLRPALRWALPLLLGLGLPLAAHVDAGAAGPTTSQPAGALEAYTVQPESGGAGATSLQAVVEAVRQATVSSQVPGTVEAVAVVAGQSVRAGQLLVRIDARAAEQQVHASSAQVEAARAALTLAEKEYQRQAQLLAKAYISPAALERAQAQRDSARAQLEALQAQTRVAQTQTGFFNVTAPFDGLVDEVPVTKGDMAMPGRALVQMHDPSALRVVAAVPQSLIARAAGDAKAWRVEITGSRADVPLIPESAQLLPVTDPATHTTTVRLGLPRDAEGARPGAYARVWLPRAAAGSDAAATAGASLRVPASAVLRRGEFTGVYVLDEKGHARLRQVRLGRSSADRVEVLAGLRAGERMAVDARAAAR